MPMETAIRRPCNKASYSAALLESLYNIWSTYWTTSPVGDVRTTPAPSPASILEPSKYITQLEYVPYSLGSWASVHSATKSASTLGFNGSTRFVCYVKWKELNGPFGNPASGVPVVDDIIEWYFGSHRDRTLLKVVPQLTGVGERSNYKKIPTHMQDHGDA